MRLRSATALGLLLAGTLGCWHNTSNAGPRPPFQPAGVQVQVSLKDGSKKQTVELLAVEDTALIAVRSSDGAAPRLVLIRLANIKRADIPSIDGWNFVDEGAYKLADLRRQAALLARYPQGIDPRLLASLLSAFHQDALVDLGSGS